MTFGPNDSPLSAREGTQLTADAIQDRLKAEAEVNVAMQVVPVAAKELYEVRGRGELHLGILIENMRREGFELSVSPPVVVFTQDENGHQLEPVEEVIIDVDSQFMGIVIEKMCMSFACHLFGCLCQQLCVKGICLIRKTLPERLG